jgi:hypothetical protein
MTRRGFCLCCLGVITTIHIPAVAHAAKRKFVFKIKTKDGGIVGNIVIEAKDAENAKYKLRQRWEGERISRFR